MYSSIVKDEINSNELSFSFYIRLTIIMPFFLSSSEQLPLQFTMEILFYSHLYIQRMFVYIYDTYTRIWLMTLIHFMNNLCLCVCIHGVVFVVCDTCWNSVKNVVCTKALRSFWLICIIKVVDLWFCMTELRFFFFFEDYMKKKVRKAQFLAFFETLYKKKFIRKLSKWIFSSFFVYFHARKHHKRIHFLHSLHFW